MDIRILLSVYYNSGYGNISSRCDGCHLLSLNMHLMLSFKTMSFLQISFEPDQFIIPLLIGNRFRIKPFNQGVLQCICEEMIS